jgi:hypothetical protein
MNEQGLIKTKNPDALPRLDKNSSVNQGRTTKKALNELARKRSNKQRRKEQRRKKKKRRKKTKVTSLTDPSIQEIQKAQG